MPCERTRTVDPEGVEHDWTICTNERPKKAPPCFVCGEPADYLCDFPDKRHRSGTCDRDLCNGCRRTQVTKRHVPIDVSSKAACGWDLTEEGKAYYGKIRIVEDIDFCPEHDEATRNVVLAPWMFER
ncbi:MAG: hypothetical protein HOW73_44945 [Polyangiaceae bacterium]|nr:hypothetical protein [Polyangiaceae bacterium]